MDDRPKRVFTHKSVSMWTASKRGEVRQKLCSAVIYLLPVFFLVDGSCGLLSKYFLSIFLCGSVVAGLTLLVKSTSRFGLVTSGNMEAFAVLT